MSRYLMKNGKIQDPRIPHLESEFGSNANGNYIKFANGLMMCWAVKNTGSITWEGDNSYALASVTFDNFPVSFIETPIVVKSVQGADRTTRRVTIGAKTNATTTNPGDSWLWGYYQTNGNNYDVSYIAIGRWK